MWFMYWSIKVYWGNNDCLYCFYFSAAASDTSDYLLQIMITVPDPQLLLGLNEFNVSLEFNNSIVVIDSQVTTGNTNVLLLYKSRHVYKEDGRCVLNWCVPFFLQIVCTLFETGYKCRCQPHFAWSPSICNSHEICYPNVTDTCECINGIPADGQQCQEMLGRPSS